jgi:hypothetical protein
MVSSKSARARFFENWKITLKNRVFTPNGFLKVASKQRERERERESGKFASAAMGGNREQQLQRRHRDDKRKKHLLHIVFARLCFKAGRSVFFF